MCDINQMSDKVTCYRVVCHDIMILIKCYDISYLETISSVCTEVQRIYHIRFTIMMFQYCVVVRGGGC